MKKWKDVCRSFTVDRLHNRGSTDANLIFIAKAAYGMRETAPVQVDKMGHLPQTSQEEIAQRYASFKEIPQEPDFD